MVELFVLCQIKYSDSKVSLAGTIETTYTVKKRLANFPPSAGNGIVTNRQNLFDVNLIVVKLSQNHLHVWHGVHINKQCGIPRLLQAEIFFVMPTE